MLTAQWLRLAGAITVGALLLARPGEGAAAQGADVDRCRPGPGRTVADALTCAGAAVPLCIGCFPPSEGVRVDLNWSEGPDGRRPDYDLHIWRPDMLAGARAHVYHHTKRKHDLLGGLSCDDMGSAAVSGRSDRCQGGGERITVQREALRGVVDAPLYCIAIVNYRVPTPVANSEWRVDVSIDGAARIRCAGTTFLSPNEGAPTPSCERPSPREGAWRPLFAMTLDVEDVAVAVTPRGEMDTSCRIVMDGE